MCARFTPQGLHKGVHIIGKEFRGIDSFRLVSFASPPWIDGDAGKVLGVLGNLESIAGAIRGQERNQDQRLSGSLLIVVHGDTVRFDLGHLIVSFLLWCVWSFDALGSPNAAL